MGEVRSPGVPGRQHNATSLSDAGRRYDLPAVLVPVEPHNLHPELRLNIEPARVPLQVTDQMVLTQRSQWREIGAPGRPERERAVCSRRLAYLLRQEAPIESARSSNSYQTPRCPSAAATARPPAPAPTMVTWPGRLEAYAMCLQRGPDRF